MNRALIITAAGRSQRFSQSIGRDVNKVLFYEEDPMDSLLYRQLHLAIQCDFQNIVVVGGHLIWEVKDFISSFYGENDRIQVAYNENFETGGTAHTFARGLAALREDVPDEVVLMEGDLFVDEKSFREVVSSKSDVITLNREKITSQNSVIFYVSQAGQLTYEYDTNHEVLEVRMPFTFLGNSGQIWKFTDFRLLNDTLENYGTALSSDTNLLPIQDYFNKRGLSLTQFISLRQWINCNTVDDYRLMLTAGETINEAT